jgi:4-hydroxy-4-methyl-2-oxoglutarate aldolase
MKEALSADQLDAIRQLSTCTVANAIETFDLRLRDEGYALSTIRSVFPNLPPMVGYAATLRIRCTGVLARPHLYPDDTNWMNWWNYVQTIPGPRVVVIQDSDERPGTGAFLGETQATILKALGCAGAVTNGAVRDLPVLSSMGFPVFAGSVSVSHAYVHILEFGKPVEVGGLIIRPGDLLHGDCHGVLSIPEAIAADIPAVAEKFRQRAQRIAAVCHASDFSLEKLCDAVTRKDS